MEAGLEELLLRLGAAAEVAERVHRERLVEFAEEALRLLMKDDVRGAAERTWMVFRSLLGLLVVKRLLPVIESEVRRVAAEEGAEKARKLVEWWVKQGLLVPSTRRELDNVVDEVVKVTGDREVAEKRLLAAHLRVFYRHGPDIACIGEGTAAEMVKELVEWARRKAEQYKLL